MDEGILEATPDYWCSEFKSVDEEEKEALKKRYISECKMFLGDHTFTKLNDQVELVRRFFDNLSELRHHGGHEDRMEGLKESYDELDLNAFVAGSYDALQQDDKDRVERLFCRAWQGVGSDFEDLFSIEQACNNLDDVVVDLGEITGGQWLVNELAGTEVMSKVEEMACEESGDINFHGIIKAGKSKDVIDTFVDSYVMGETPIPCIQCNQTVKFRDLYLYAKELKADALVTGHYVNRIQKNGSAQMYRAEDLSRDQSYFLFNTTQEQLNFLRFPLGKLLKKDTRKIASDLNLNVADKPDSQDICFVPNGDYASVIKKFRPETFKKGNILDTSGKIIGKHEGIINFTIGQRKGIKISHQEPLYVIDIKANTNEVIVGDKEFLKIKKIFLKDINLLGDLKSCSENLYVKVRSTGKLTKAKAEIDNSKASVTLEDAEMGISPGQACVFYSKNKFGHRVLGGGWINKTTKLYPHN